MKGETEILDRGLNAFNSLSRDHTSFTFRNSTKSGFGLSTPSLGITSMPIPGGGPRCAMSLSTPSLGITKLTFNRVVNEMSQLAFNSLSRDHLKRLRAIATLQLSYFQLPLPGSRCHERLRARDPRRGGFQLPLSGSQDLAALESGVLVDADDFQLPLSGSQLIANAVSTDFVQ